VNDLLLVFALIGTTLIVARSTMLRPVRRLWPAMLACPQCVGTWVGVAAGATSVVSLGYGKPLDALIVGTATSFLSLLADAVLSYLLGPPEGKDP
jgi:hypothetical protein